MSSLTLDNYVRGKNRVVYSDPEESDAASTSDTPIPSAQFAPFGKARRAVTKKCPVCDEEIPVRLLERHADLEAERLDEIMRSIGSMEVLEMAEPDDGLTARTRRSAVQARKNMQPKSFATGGPSSSDTATLELVDKSLRLIKRRRKQRHAKLRDMTREDEDSGGLSGFRGGRGRWTGSSEGTLCPVCMKIVPGDPDVVEAHVDACLAHGARMQGERDREQRERQRDESPWEEVDVESEVQLRATDGVSFRGMGFAVRDDTQRDVDDDVDVDGEDEAVYGAAQFSEGDVLNPISNGQPGKEDSTGIGENGDDPSQSPGASGSGLTTVAIETIQAVTINVVGLGPESHFDVNRTMDDVMGVAELEELDRAVQRARRIGDTAALVLALENKMKILTPIPSPQYPLAAGIPVVGNVGYGAWVQPAYVQSASVSPQLLIYEEYIYDLKSAISRNMSNLSPSAAHMLCSSYLSFS
ncbi:hypothetical protein PHLCEN_2v4679 [Hermanssonia centrifuga]|uniref:E3 ubiquitin-protein ligase RNF220 middle domain-containing protein n=1 Tax=Hermanssonia centrifuga TaxID=98765 RepID=A0A2R6PNS0_9APHY|nr:hypothetical protein PHLCEN_2v4679 [Hermanssonia centrifuga]